MKLVAAIALIGAALCATPSGAQTPAATLTFGDLPGQMQVTDVKRTDAGTTITVRGVVTNSSGQDVSLGQTSDMYLVDFKNRRRYGVIMDSSVQCVCAPSGAANVPATGSLHVWAKFPAPPEGVTTMSFGWGRAEPVDVQIGR